MSFVSFPVIVITYARKLVTEIADKYLTSFVNFVEMCDLLLSFFFFAKTQSATTNAFSLTVRAGGWHEVTNLSSQNRSRRSRQSLPFSDLFIALWSSSLSRDALLLDREARKTRNFCRCRIMSTKTQNVVWKRGCIAPRTSNWRTNDRHIPRSVSHNACSNRLTFPVFQNTLGMFPGNSQEERTVTYVLQNFAYSSRLQSI